MHMIHPPNLIDAALMVAGAACYAAGIVKGRRDRRAGTIAEPEPVDVNPLRIRCAACTIAAPCPPCQEQIDAEAAYLAASADGLLY